MFNLSRRYSSASYPEDIDEEPLTSEYIDEEPTHLLTPQSTQSPAPAVVPSELATPRDPQPDTGLKVYFCLWEHLCDHV